VTRDQAVSVLIGAFVAIFNRRLFVFFRAPIDRHPLLEVVERLSRKPGHKFDDSSEAFGCLDPPAQPKSGLVMSHKDSLFAVGLQAEAELGSLVAGVFCMP
jgi:hypothetical protein